MFLWIYFVLKWLIEGVLGNGFMTFLEDVFVFHVYCSYLQGYLLILGSYLLIKMFDKLEFEVNINKISTVYINFQSIGIEM